MAKRQKHRCVECYVFKPHYHSERWIQPVLRKKSARIGVSFMGDFFDSRWLKQTQPHIELFAIMERAYWHTFIILTKQPQNIPLRDLPDNIWIGVSVNRKNDLWRIESLKKSKAKVKIVSFEPLYEDLSDADLQGIDWIIIGAQTRPLLFPDYMWVLGLIQNALSREIPVFIKDNLEPIMSSTPLLQQFPKTSVSTGTTPTNKQTNKAE